MCFTLNAKSYLWEKAFLVEQADDADRFRRPAFYQVDACLVVLEGDVRPVDALSLVRFLLQLAQVPAGSQPSCIETTFLLCQRSLLENLRQLDSFVQFHVCVRR